MEQCKKNRKRILDELSNFIESSQEVVETTLKALGWDEENLNKVVFKTCPFNPEHQVPEKSLAQHIDICSLRQDGYSLDSEFLPDSGPHLEPCIVLDEARRTSVIHQCKAKNPEMRTILWLVCITSCYRCDGGCDSHHVPRTCDRILSSTTPDERLALYDHVVEKTKYRHSEDLPLDLPFPDDATDKKSEPKSLLEVLAQERDAKRRRTNYKRVHTNRKSHTEILREVIQNQMEMLANEMKHDN